MDTNMVIAGDYKGRWISNILGSIEISLGLTKGIPLDKFEVESYQLITEDNSKSAAGTLVKASIGEAFFGDAGMLAGALASKTDYILEINFKDGKRSLVVMDAKIYRIFLAKMF